MVHRGRQLHNSERDLEAIANGYENQLQTQGDDWLSYALQKDVVQNSWDARLSKNGEWGLQFQLLDSSKGNFLVITDKGTSGLLGSLWDNDQEQIDLLNSEDTRENLAFFLSSNFSNKTSGSGGKRGRGKSLFLVASQDKAFFFESLRADNVRVFGGQYIDPASKSIEYDLTRDKTFLSENVGTDISSMNKPGTRIFIKNPDRHLLSAIKNGTFIDHIQKTWWEIIKKYDAKIVTSVSGVKTIARVPDFYQDDLLANKPDLKIKEYPNLNIEANGQKLKVKRIKLIYDPNGTTPDDLKGIAIQRSGMTIERKTAENLVKEEGMQKVYGWVEMEAPLEEAMYDLENVEHLGFNWRKDPAAKLRNEIQAKIRDFAREVKIIESELSKEHNLHKKIEDSVAGRINKYLTGLGYKGTSAGSSSTKSHAKNADLPLRISVAGFKTPNSTKRVEYGEQIKATAQVINDLEIPVNIKLKVWIVSSKGNKKRSLERDLILKSKETFDLGWENIDITEKEFPRGDYSFRSKIIIMEDIDITLPKVGLLEKGNDQIKSGLSFCIDKEPKQKGFLRFMGTSRDIYLDSYREEGEVIIEYGTEHPYISKFMDIKNEVELERFLMQNGIILALNEILIEDIAADKPKLFKNIKGGKMDETEVLRNIMQYVGVFLRD